MHCKSGNKPGRSLTPVKCIHGHQLANVKTGKYLAVTFANDLSWKAHIHASIKSANSSLAFLRRNLSSCPKDIKLQCYKTLVRPVLDYRTAAWDPHTKTCITQLEAVQRRVARFITGNYRTTSSTNQMIADLGLNLLSSSADSTLSV